MDNNYQSEIHKQSLILLFVLIVQYVLGMTLAMFASGISSERTILDRTVFILHIITGLVLLVVSITIYNSAKKLGDKLIGKLVFYGIVSIILSLSGGIIYVAANGNIATVGSLIMAFSFLMIFSVYGYLSFITREIKNRLV
jgi:hypothetical protein